MLFNRDQIYLMSTQDMIKYFEHKRVNIDIKNDGLMECFIIKISLASNEPHHPVGFILDNKRHLGIECINSIEVL